MDDNKLIAEALLEIAKKSATEFIEVGQDYELIETAEKFNIKLPSPDLAVIKTVYAEIDKVNRNGVILPREAVKSGLPTLIGKQINWEHQGSGRICGYIIDAEIKEDQIEITGVIFKSLFPEEMEQVKEKFIKKELCVSFEIWNKNPETKESVMTENEKGFKIINPIIFHGCGLLLTNKPACPKAKVYKLVAKVLNETEKIIDKVFGEDLVFASSAIEEPVCKNCTTCNCEKEEHKVELSERLCPECKQPLKEEDKELCAECLKKKEEKEKSSEETKIEDKPVETKTEEKSEVAETKTEETKVEETKEETITEKKEEAQTVEEAPIERKIASIITEETVTTIETMDGKVERKGMRKVTRKFDDNTEEVFSEEYQVVQTYTEAQLEEKVNTVKSEKDTEIATLKSEHEKVLSEKDTELKNKNEELGKKDQEIAELKNPKVEEKKEKELTVGTVEVKDNMKVIQKGIDDRAFGKR